MHKWTVYVGIFCVQFSGTFSGMQCPVSCSCQQTEIDCSHKRLNSVPEKIPMSTERLFLNHNQIQGIRKSEFCFLPNLIELRLQNNKISSLSPLAFSGDCLSKIQTIRLENNWINVTEAGTFFNLTSLVNVTLTNNHLIYMNSETFQGAPLDFLHLGGNKLRNIPNLQNMEHLRDLVLEGNSIVNCTFPKEFKKMTRLNKIGLSNNKIQGLGNEAFVHLQQGKVRTLKVARNNITKIAKASFLSLTSLQSLNLGRNPLTDKELSNALSGLLKSTLNSLSIPNLRFNGFLPTTSFLLLERINLSTIDLSFNEFYNLPAQSFHKLPHLKSLDLRNCGIRGIDENAFGGLEKLTNLILRNNYIVEIPLNLPKNLMYLYMDGNQIEALNNDAFLNLTSLKRLQLGDNKILTLFKDAFAGLNNLKDLQLHGNRINTLPKHLFQPFSNLITLSLQENRLKMIQNSTATFFSIPALKYLNLADNGLSSIPISLFSNLNSLLELYLNGNKLGKYLLDDKEGRLFYGLKNVSTLDLSSNQIHTFSSRLFSDMTNLQTLKLHDNWISGLEGVIFSKSKSMRALDLSSNMISVLNEESMKGLDSVKEINFINNPFACTCDLLWFRGWIGETKTVLPNLEKYLCNSPPEWKGNALLSFDEKKIECNLISVTFAFLIACGIVFLSLLVFKYRLYIKYYRYLIKRAICRRFKERNHNGLIPMDFDACIINSYTTEDYEWIKNNILHDFDDNGQGHYKIYFGERDTLGNADRLQTMMEIMEKSRKIIVVVSEHLKVDPLQIFFIKEALSLKGNTLSDIIVVVVDMPFAEVPRLQQFVRDGRHVEWKNGDIHKRVFRQKMEEKLKN